jgi:hypothetical protein
LRVNEFSYRKGIAAKIAGDGARPQANGVELSDGRKQEERIRNKQKNTEKTEKILPVPVFSVCSVSFRLFRTLSFLLQ